ncbi:MAG: VanZ family protein [Bacteroidales bacterium]|nr:VanZ family protein [Bacteroidales bacterium]
MLKKILFFAYLVLITALSLWPSDGLPDVTLVPFADKLIHAGMYAGFTFLMLWAWPEEFSGAKQILPLLLVIAWGFLMEVLQQYSYFGRSFDITDELANSLGFLPGWIGWRWFGRRHA